ncbi:hypothetical protein MNBD_PLANCTO02-650 [hydrothermal vent metagenome]|uniref:Uncharacterized protein n=1 Tax=hydrothermal vent metagenome TaxID=652676 RepID=A0A3B1DWJ0_9ZZZZ
MQQIKIFKNIESEIDELEREVNSWIAESRVTIVNIFGNIAPQTPGVSPSSGLGGGAFAPSDVMLVVLYISTQKKT